ncbi:divergent polysaccharide deacetylase family protein [Magnetospirillum sp. UT-4]|uniref:divergent polysaccharide deacetylase family protein n=1 Tax=Magnetospirillum sp. UT-4 TaxID=2681467 RepID=UPI00137E39FC|nr:divergent polysaccharide deacetylase family protein [Magnetospirillum sp. UT-4]CAA7615191.1 conserved exported hypothetical protein [Magnetospirillum sp. UT-4]
MSRREIRRLLLEPRNRLIDRPWVAPVLMVAVLLVGIGVGAAVGVAILANRAEQQARQSWEEAELAVERPAQRELPPPGPAEAGLVEPVVPVPPPRPGGPADDGAEIGPEAEAPAEAETAALPLILPQPPVVPGLPDTPAWLRHAVPAPKVAGRPMIAVVIDDLGVDRKRSERVAALRPPLTLSYLTYATNLAQATASARQRGHELMLHVPMQPQGQAYDPGPDVLEVEANPEENRRRLNWGMNRFDGFVGINNHMGSRFTADRVGMRVVMEELKRRGLLFLDSVTTEKSVAPELAKRYGVPFAARHVFIDNDPSLGSVRVQLNKAEAHARKHGAAIVIGHPHDATIEALAQWLPGLEARGLTLVPVTAIIKAGAVTQP